LFFLQSCTSLWHEFLFFSNSFLFAHFLARNPKFPYFPYCY
jgi:hypothetical protein